ncbi:MAG: DUF308 domain-containing protein [Acidimicrobiales bacterium]|nr:DUF308 domain-containing protein [Acidimicrobiales bacterium]MCB9371706.1 DUF308 domain-containing protein [Microthrixaceae bacterium]
MDAISDDEVQAGARLWWLMLVIGIVSITIGVLMITRPFKSVAALAWLAGLFLLIGGISGFFGARRRQVGVGWAVVSVLVGLVLLVWPDVTVQVLAVVAGIGYLLRGVFRAVAAFTERDDYTVPLLVVGVVGLLFGVALIVWPDAGVALVGLLLGIGALVAGIGEVITAFELKKLRA